MSVAAVVVAGGRGSRFGAAKQFADLDGETVSARSVRVARSVASTVVLVVPEGYDGSGEGADVIVTGGPTRAASVRAGLTRCTDADIVVVHDAARPLASHHLFNAVVNAVLSGADAAVPGLSVTDTVKKVVDENGSTVIRDTVAREDLVTVQTPQAFRRDVLERAHASRSDATDDAALVEALGARVIVIPGETSNIKITEPRDLERAARRSGSGSLRVGHGLDVHRVSDDPARTLVLALVPIEGAPGLEGHSDADVATHALCDALLGGANLGDLGRHFPDSDPDYEGVPSRQLLDATLRLVHEAGFSVLSGDVTIIAERPKLTPYMAEMREGLTAMVGVAVSVKATTAEGLGALGRVEGIGATAVVLLEAAP
ncbi:MAG: 2-C-methyl-D-erythritol 2,4-cyclodiphosphate synthase [Acidimicrobiales bacterium]|jgi:2-C-methyl-D-erythritol 4-phosphate cytidylyltransferase/2-C-methyl-D-erythritol 2,4-cyclodiphosphate synthase